MKDLTHAKALLVYLKKFGIGHYQRIDIYLKECFPADSDYQAFLNFKNDGRFWSLILELKELELIDYRKSYGLDNSLQVEAAIRPEGEKYINKFQEVKIFGIALAQIKKYAAQGLLAALFAFIITKGDNFFLSKKDNLQSEKGTELAGDQKPSNNISFQKVQEKEVYPFEYKNTDAQLYQSNLMLTNLIHDTVLFCPVEKLLNNAQPMVSWASNVQNSKAGFQVSPDGSILYNPTDALNVTSDFQSLLQKRNGLLSIETSPFATNPTFATMSNSDEDKSAIDFLNPVSPSISATDWTKYRPGQIINLTGVKIDSLNTQPEINRIFLSNPADARWVTTNGILLGNATNVEVLPNSNALTFGFKAVGIAYGPRTAAESDILEILDFAKDKSDVIYIDYDNQDEESTVFAKDIYNKILDKYSDVVLSNSSRLSILGSGFIKFTLSRFEKTIFLSISKLKATSL